jgi:pimeloyl-ACP methyl ester carboxylesterase
VTITAKDGNGNTVTSINGNMSLSASIGNIYPTSVQMQSGVAVVDDMRVFSSGRLVIMGSLQGYYGSSDEFTVSGAMNTASITGKVVNGDGGAWGGAVVHLNSVDGTSLTTTSDSSGKYSFTNLVPGRYSLWAEDDLSANRSIKHTVDLGDNTKAVQNIEISNALCNPSTLTPVLLVPGIMGSSVGWGGPYPILPREPPDWKEFPKKTKSWGLHDPLGIAGWRDLYYNSLEPLGYKLGCTVFPVPYDWRMDINDAAREYLKKWIDEAKNKAGTSKVNIIAHSMGGLLTRAYIQSEGYDNDIDRFAMVGTPNHGSSLTYYMVEGGDPVEADNAALKTDPGSIIPYLFHFYERTSGRMYSTYNRLPLAPVGSLAYRLQMYNLYKDHIPSAAQLLPTYGFLDSDRSLDCVKNQFLIDLNSDSDINRMGNVEGKVITKLFAGNGTNTTLNGITAGPKICSAPLYKDGVPLNLLLTSEGDGDGTVLLSSASLGIGQEISSRDASHAKLVKAYSDPFSSPPLKAEENIVVFIYGHDVTSSIAQNTLASAESQSTTNQVAVMLFGRGRILVTDPSGKRCGLDPVTDELLDEIPENDVSMDGEKAAVSFANGADGNYTISVKNAFNEDYRLAVSYIDDGSVVQKEVAGFNHANTIAIPFTMNSAATNKITINQTPLAPANLQADAIDSGGLKTRLTWSASSDPLVTDYNIYSKYFDEPYLAQVGTSTSATFDTADAWVTDTFVKTRIYAVSAIKGDGTESFLSNMVQNDDRDHDGLTDVDETAAGTDPTKADTDGEGLKDGEEMLRGTNPKLADTDGDGYNDFVEVQFGSDPLDPASFPTYKLTVVKGSTGSGTVTFTPPGSAQSLPYTGQYTPNTLVTLTATANGSSVFGGWSGGGCSGTGNCAVTVNGDRSVTAIFNLLQAARITGTPPDYHPTLTAALGAATSGKTVEARDLEFLESLNISKALTLKGGFILGYSTNTGYTTLQGNLTVQSGSLTVERLVIR